MDWTRGPIIGRGSTATVSAATNHCLGEVFAVKSAEFSQSQLLIREQEILSTLNCPQIVEYKGCQVSSENGKLLYNLFLEFAPNGTLIDVIHNHGGGGGLNEGLVQSYTHSILLGLEYLHSSKGIVHCDIKGQNILVASEGAKIADFGCARWVNGDLTTALPIAGTPAYMAPEVARGEQQGFPADIWALGCTVIEMATGKPPWDRISDPVSALYRIGFSGEVPEIPSFMSKQGKDFLSKCLARDPMKRWSASELLKHEFVKDHNFLFKKVTSSSLDSPTSVLNHRFWDFEELETNWKLTQKSSSCSAKYRIQKLSEDNEKLPNWVWDSEDSWIKVRGDFAHKEHEMVGCEQKYGLLCGNESTSSVWFGPNWVSEECDFVSIYVPKRISQINICQTRNVSYMSRHKKRSFMTCASVPKIWCVELFVPEIKKRERKLLFAIFLFFFFSLSMYSIVAFKSYFLRQIAVVLGRAQP